MFQESIHSVGKLASMLLALEVLVACCGSQQKVSIRTPVKPPHERLVLNIVEE